MGSDRASHEAHGHMTERSPLSRPDTWNDVATGYAEELTPLFTRYAEDALRLADLPPHARVLDVASGPGTLAFLAARSADQVVAVDFAERMLQELERRAAASGITNIEIVQADGQSLPFEDGSFDGVFSMFGLIFFPDRIAGFREACRVLKSGRRAVISSWAPLDHVPLLAACFGALADLLPEFPFAEGKAPLGDESEFREEMMRGGFRTVAIHTIEHRVEVPSVSAFWRSNARSSARLALMRKQLGFAEFEALGADVVAALEREFGRGPLETTWPARLAVGAV